MVDDLIVRTLFHTGRDLGAGERKWQDQGLDERRLTYLSKVDVTPYSLSID